MPVAPKQSVVAPVDFSNPSFEALDAALDYVDDPAHLHVVYALPPLSVSEPGVIWKTIDNDGRIAHAEKSLRERLTDAKYAGIDLRAVIGEAGDAIIEVADEVNADLIVMSSHGRTGLGRVLLGSVADRVVRLAECPVLVVKPTQKRRAK